MLAFMDVHDETEVCIVQNDYDDPFNADRFNFYGITAWPTIVSGGVTDVWPLSCFEADYQLKAAVPSPLTISISENAMGDFTAHISAEENIPSAAFFMVATLDEWVNGVGGPAHLPHHIKVFMTPPSTGEPFSLMSGESIDISHSFAVDPGWDYNLMGVAAWVSRPGGDPTSPACNQGFNLIENEVLQSRWVPASPTGVEDQASSPLADRFKLSVAPNPFNPKTTVSFELAQAATISLQIYDLAGRLVDVLVADEARPAGHQSVEWNGQDRSGRQVSSGVYLCRLEAEGCAETQRMVMVR